MSSGKDKAFTLIELMIVVAVIGFLSAVTVVKYIDLMNNAHEATTKGNLGAIRSAVSLYYVTEQGIPQELISIKPDYIKKLPEGRVPTAAEPLVEYWGEDTYIRTTDADFRAYGSRGTTNNSLDGANDNGWAYDNATMEVWVETKIGDVRNQGVHKW
ncbi:MAG: prepilin-type N-terminal cleavage/methylation domain-containing protein [Elusimicrobia bacterium]|nr:prepilin-type N-terminal cleavage/methylation domain-containing protein [Elusimicrobiota bacterium]